MRLVATPHAGAQRWSTRAVSSDGERLAPVVERLRHEGRHSRTCTGAGSRARAVWTPTWASPRGGRQRHPSPSTCCCRRGDLLVLNTAPLLIAGRVAAHGRLIFDDDPLERVRWEATTRKVSFDEPPRMERADRDFAETVRRGR